MHFINQSINQSTDQDPTNQSINQSNVEPINQSINQPINQSIDRHPPNQSINQSKVEPINQSINQSMYGSALTHYSGHCAERVGQSHESAREGRRDVDVIDLEAGQRQRRAANGDDQERDRTHHVATDVAHCHQTHRRDELSGEVKDFTDGCGGHDVIAAERVSSDSADGHQNGQRNVRQCGQDTVFFQVKMENFVEIRRKILEKFEKKFEKKILKKNFEKNLKTKFEKNRKKI